jgi:hypothetical protein
MPATKPGITFDHEGVCNACRYTESMYDRDHGETADQLTALADEAKRIAHERGVDWDVVVPVSGGKDSLYICHTMAELDLRVLGIFVRPLRITPRGQRNFDNLTRQFPTLTYCIDDDANGIRTALRESFERKGLPLQPYDDLIYGIPEKIATKLGVPLVMRGEASEKFYGNKPEKAQQYQHLEAEGTRCCYLSDYSIWDSQMTAKFSMQHGLEVRHPREGLGTGGYWLHEQLDDMFPIVSHWLKWLKFGYGRATDQACRDIRAGRVPTDKEMFSPLADSDIVDAREAGFQLVKKYDGQIGNDYIAAYCDYIGITMADFFRIARYWDKYGVIEA